MEEVYYDIIIAGAGTTGLLLANQLARFGIDFLILDKKEGPTKESRALVVQARSMEIYEQMGLSEEVIKAGQPSGGISLYKKGRRKASVFLKTMGGTISPFPYIMIYEQSENENLLYRKLQGGGREVQWDTEIQQVEEKEGRYHLQTSGARYSCKYLIACDGSRSMVREFSGMPFTGGTYENIFYVADTHARGAQLSSDMLSLFLTRKTITFLFPMPGKERFRLLGILPKEYYHRDNIQIDELFQHVKSNIQVPVEFYDTQWYSTYKLHHKKVGHFNKGNIFFAGDAAHVHSPAGGQGMNTGLQDAYNLAWKMALIIRGVAAEDLLNTYHEERNPIAERLLKTTDRLFTVMTKSSGLFSFIKMFVVPRVAPLVNKFAGPRRRWFEEVSQTRIHYKGSSLSKGEAGKIKAGERLPYFLVRQGKDSVSVFHLIRLRHQTPFLLIYYNLRDNPCQAMDPGIYSKLDLEVNDTNDATLQKIGFPGSFIILLRPDNYIGYISETPDKNEILQFMRSRYFLR